MTKVLRIVVMNEKREDDADEARNNTANDDRVPSEDIRTVPHCLTGDVKVTVIVKYRI